MLVKDTEERSEKERDRERKHDGRNFFLVMLKDAHEKESQTIELTYGGWGWGVVQSKGLQLG